MAGETERLYDMIWDGFITIEKEHPDQYVAITPRGILAYDIELYQLDGGILEPVQAFLGVLPEENRVAAFYEDETADRDITIHCDAQDTTVRDSLHRLGEKLETGFHAAVTVET